MRICLRSILFIITLFVLAVPGIRAEEAKETNLSWKDYRMISERNIFSKSRIKRSSSYIDGSQVKTVEPGKEESYLVLRGIAKLGSSYTAFIEDIRTMDVKQVKKGAVVAGRTVNEINIDYLKYELEGKSITVKMGMTMEGSSYSVSVSPQQNFFNFTSSGTGSAASTTSAGSNTGSSESVDGKKTEPADAKSILQRLKERRKKELGE